MKKLALILLLVSLSSAHGNHKEIREVLQGQWTQQIEQEKENWENLIHLYGGNGKKKEEFLEVLDHRKNEPTFISISEDRFVLNEPEKEEIECNYTLYLSEDEKALIHVYALKKGINRIYSVRIEDKKLVLDSIPGFMPQCYKKTVDPGGTRQSH